MIEVVFAFATSFASEDSVAPAKTPAPDKLALIVAVADYPEVVAAKLPDLHGPRNDAEAVREMLVSRFDFAPDAIRVLIDGAATHEAVVLAFHDHLIARAGPNTEVVFWYSGHGAQVPDASGFEASGFDSTLVLSDSRSATHDGEFDFSDDELSSLLDALAAKGARSLVVVDACHSGGATRGGQRGRSASRGSRSLERDLVARFWPRDVELRDDDGAHHDRPGFVQIAACSSLQEAQEKPFPQPDGTMVVRGCLTHGLCWFMNAAAPGDTYRRIADRATLWIESFEPDQTPQYHGAVDRELLSGRFAARPRGFDARPTDSREIVISAGSLHGIRPRTKFAIEDPTGTRLGVARTGFLGAGATTALWDESIPEAARSVVLRAVPILGTGGAEPIPLRVADADLAARLGERLAGRVSIVDLDRADAYRLEIGEIAGDRSGFAWILESSEGIALWRADDPVTSGAGDLRAVGEFERVADELGAALDHEAVHRELTALASDPGTLRVIGSLSSPDADYLDRLRQHGVPNAVAAGIDELVGAAGVAKTYRARFDPSDSVLPVAVLTIENLESEPLHVSVISVSEDRNRQIIYPEEGEVDQVLPPRDTRTFTISLNGDAMRRFPREIRDRFLLIATRRPVDFFGLVAKTTYRSASQQGVLERVFRDSTTRGTGNDDFGVAAIDVWVPSAR